MDSSIGFSILFIVISGVIGLLPVIAIGVLIYMLLKKNQNNAVGTHTTSGTTNTQHTSTNIFSIRNLIRFYLYVIVTISSFILIIGLGITGKVLIGLADQNFSYGYELASQDYNYQATTPITQTNKIVTIPNKCYGEDQELVKVNAKDYCE